MGLGAVENGCGFRFLSVIRDSWYGFPMEKTTAPRPSTLDLPGPESVLLRSALPPDSLAAGIRTALRPIEPNLAVREFQTLHGLADKVVSPRRFLVILLSEFAPGRHLIFLHARQTGEGMRSAGRKNLGCPASLSDRPQKSRQVGVDFILMGGGEAGRPPG